MGLAATAWIILGTQFHCGGVPAEIQSELSALLRGFPPPDPAASPPEVVEVRLDPDGAGLVVADQTGARRAPASTAVPLGALIEYRLVSEAVARARDRWVLHAGAVAGPRGTCLLVGEAGAGKTSLALWLWSCGLRLLTDDLCPLAHGSLVPERFARALHMDGDYSPFLFDRIPPRPTSYPADYYPFPEGSLDNPPPVTELLVLERGPRPEGELSLLSQAEAAHHLLRAVIKSPGFEYGRALADMIRLAARCRAHVLRSSTPEGAAAAAAALLIPA